MLVLRCKEAIVLALVLKKDLNHSCSIREQKLPRPNCVTQASCPSFSTRASNQTRNRLFAPFHVLFTVFYTFGCINYCSLLWGAFLSFESIYSFGHALSYFGRDARSRSYTWTNDSTDSQLHVSKRQHRLAVTREQAASQTCTSHLEVYTLQSYTSYFNSAAKWFRRACEWFAAARASCGCQTSGGGPLHHASHSSHLVI
jgi:hypothetical protein